MEKMSSGCVLRWAEVEGYGMLNDFFHMTHTGDRSRLGLAGSCVDNEPMRLTLAGDCNDFVVLGLYQQTRKITL